MPYAIRVQGLAEAQAMLSADFTPALAAATKAVALEVEDKIAPYPPATEANSPSNPTGRWYERGFGPRWSRKDGTIGGSKTSQMLGRQWMIRKIGQAAHAVANRVTYAPYVHAADQQAMFHARRHWVTDMMAIQQVIASGVVQRIAVQAIMAVLRRR